MLSRIHSWGRRFSQLCRPTVIMAIVITFMLVLSSQAAFAQTASLNQGLIGYWQFEPDNVTDTIHDRSGEGNDGRLINSSIAELGRYGRGLDGGWHLSDGLQIRVGTRLLVL